jgi:hypothetical protein
MITEDVLAEEPPVLETCSFASAALLADLALEPPLWNGLAIQLVEDLQLALGIDAHARSQPRQAGRQAGRHTGRQAGKVKVWKRAA